MINPRFDFETVNDDPRIFTILLIGTEESVKAHILRQHTLGLTEAGTWSKPLPLPNCPDKVVCIVNKVMA